MPRYGLSRLAIAKHHRFDWSYLYTLCVKLLGGVQEPCALCFWPGRTDSIYRNRSGTGPLYLRFNHLSLLINWWKVASKERSVFDWRSGRSRGAPSLNVRWLMLASDTPVLLPQSGFRFAHLFVSCSSSQHEAPNRSAHTLPPSHSFDTSSFSRRACGVRILSLTPSQLLHPAA